MKVTAEQVEKALASLDAQLASDDELVSKASEDDLDQPEGADLGNPAKEKLSDEAKKDGKVKKGEDDEDEDEDFDDEDEKPVAKSWGEEMPEEIQTKIDVSEFLKSLVDHTGSVIDNLKDYVAKSDEHHEARYGSLVEAVDDIQKSQAKIGVVLKAICQRIGVIESAPARAPRAETVAKSDGAERSFSSGLEGDEAEPKMFKSLSDNPIVAKSQMAEALCELVRKGEAADLDVIGFESGGYVRPELVSKLKTVLN